MRRLFSRVTVCGLIGLLAMTFWVPPIHASSIGIDNVKEAQLYIDKATQAAKQGDLKTAQQDYDRYHQRWFQIESAVKQDSGQAYTDMESNMGQIEYAFLQHKQSAIVQALEGLTAVDRRYINGNDRKGQLHVANRSLSDFILMLQQTREKVQNHDQGAALTSIKEVRNTWLSVEGGVVAKSSTAYNASERDMVEVQAMIESAPPDYTAAVRVLDGMIAYLKPMVSNGYTMWDAAMIPIREGIESLLVVGALLAIVKKSKSGGTRWILSGVGAGVLLSVAVAILIKIVFSAGTFGNNNFLIAGWTGVIAALMLLYMSYWLHSKTNVSEWNRYIREKSQNVLGTGRLAGLGVLACLAVFREGAETVLFLVGMVNQISMRDLLVGLIIGIGILLVIAYLMLVVGMKLPIRPFFLVSSLIVFYLCLKFTGMGIHSLQLAGALPSTTATHVPSVDFLALYPSWQSAVPQLILLLVALGVVFWKSQVKRKRTHHADQQAVPHM